MWPFGKKQSTKKKVIERVIVGLIIGGAIGSIVGKKLMDADEENEKGDRKK